MRKYLLSGLAGIILLVIAACGSDDPTQAPVTAPTTAPGQATTAPVATTAPSSGQTPAANTLEGIASKLAGGPGAIYVGDVSQLAGPSPGEGLGDGNGQVPLAMVQKNRWIFETDYYQSLLEKAKFTDPTELTSSGEEFNIQYACINRALLPCALQIQYFAPNILARTNGQVDFEVSSFPELGLSGADMIQLVQEGTISFAQIQPAYVGGTMPLIDIIYIWGLWKDSESEHLSNTAMLTELDAAMEENTGGGKVIYHIWYGGNDQFFFSARELRTPADFAGLKTRSHGTTMTDFINGLGGEGQFMAFAEVYTALERGILNAGVTGGHAGFGQRWYEVTDYLVGPAISMPMGFETMNKDAWEGIPADLQAIIIEEGAKMELENLRLAAVWNETAISVNTDAGMEYIKYDDAMLDFVYNDVTLGRVLPNWIKRVGPEEIALFNSKVAPFAGVSIGDDGSITITGTGQAVVTASAKLQAYADAHAGGPGAIYVGDINQLVGPANPGDLGDFDGNVPLKSLESHRFIYESDYYRELVEKAKLENPTELVSTGESIELQDACINRTLSFCMLSAEFFHKNVLARTDGQIKIEVTSYPELGISGVDNLELIGDGTLGMAIVAGPYVAGEVPALDMTWLEGLYPDRETMYNALSASVPDLIDLHEEATGDRAKVLLMNWSPGDDRYFFSKKPLRTVEDFEGMKVRAFGTTISDWIIGMGADAQFVAFAEVYTALERGILDAGVTGASPAYGQRWYEVTEYMNGPLVNFPILPTMINNEVWDNIPSDLQQILVEEAAKTELEMLRVSSIHNDIILEKSIAAGLEFVEFTPDVRARSNAALVERVVPNWVKRVGGGEEPVIALFNKHIGSRIGMKVESDGSVVVAPITKK
jgi:TRAP-type C4-dicarboxylate transport system substrate-binding protein